MSMQGFGGGSPNEQPSAETAIPEQDPAYGQSLGQDLSNVQKAAQKVAPGPLDFGNENTAGVGPPPPAQGDSMPARIMSYLSGHGSMDTQQWDAAEQKIDPNGTMDQNERTTRMVDQFGTPALQHARTQYDLYKANAAKALAGGNDELVAQEATQAHNYMPDGSKTVFAPAENGFTVGVWTPDGETQKFNLTKPQMNSMLRGEHGLFDNVIESSAQNILSAVQKAGGTPYQPTKQTVPGQSGVPPGVASMQPGTEPTNEGVAPEPNARPGKGTVAGNIPPAGGYQRTEDVLANGPTSGNGPTRGNDKGIHRNGVTRLPTPGEPDTDAMQEAANASESGPKPYWNAEQGRYEYDPKDVKTSAGGTRGPIRVISGGVKPEDAGNIPSAQFMPGHSQRSVSSGKGGTHISESYQQGHSQLGPTANQRNAPRDIAAANIQGRQDVADTLANSRENVAATNAAARAHGGRTGSDTPEGRNERAHLVDQRLRDQNFQNTYNAYMKSGQVNPNTNAPYKHDEIIAEMQKRGFQVPQAQGQPQGQQPQGNQQQYNTQAPRDPQARVPNMIYVTPAMGPMRWTGTGWVNP